MLRSRVLVSLVFWLRISRPSNAARLNFDSQSLGQICKVARRRLREGFAVARKKLKSQSPDPSGATNLLQRSLLICPGIAAIVVFACTQGAIAQSYEILTGNPSIQRAGRTYSSGRGTKIVEGDTLVVRGATQFLGDFGSFVATAKTGFYQATQLRRYRGCIRNVISYQGAINITPVPFLCPFSILQIISLRSGGSYTFRGTNAWLEDEGSSTKLIVEHGLVEVSAQGSTVPVPTGYGNITKEGKAPGAPIALDGDLSLSNVRIVRSALGVEISAKVNPLNNALIQGDAITGAIRGGSKTLIQFPMVGNSLQIEVRNPQGKRRVYPYPLPR